MYFQECNTTLALRSVMSSSKFPRLLDEIVTPDTHTAAMTELIPLLTKRAPGREISGLSAYEQ